jgi:hypothetical protein
VTQLALARLSCELLDAHVDTMLLARDLDRDPSWSAHLAYLRDLRRVGQETLALACNPGRRVPGAEDDRA